MYVRTVKTKGETYVRVVETYREKGNPKPKQRVIANLGNLKLQRNNLIKIIYGLKKLVGLGFYTPEEIDHEESLEYGTILVAEKLYEEVGLKKIIENYFTKQKSKEIGEIYTRVMILNRLSDPKSKLGIFRWLETTYIDDWKISKDISKEKRKKLVERFYKTLDFLYKYKIEIEKELYFQLRDLFNLKVDIVFYDLTSTYFEGDGPEDLAQLGKNRDEKTRNKQIIIGLIMCGGFPIGHHVFEGSRADKKTVKEVVEDLKTRFEIGRCIFVGDRGLVSKETIEFLEDKKYEYIVALKRRRSLEAAKAIEVELNLGDKIASLSKESDNPEKQVDFYAKEIDKANDVSYEEWGLASCESRRLILCLNTKMAKEEKQKRAEKMQKVKLQLEELFESVKNRNKVDQRLIIEKATKILSHHNGTRYFKYEVKGDGQFNFYEDKKSLSYEEKLDGKFILLTNNKLLSVEQIVKTYKELAEIERAFKELKDFLKIRPIYHYTAKRVKAHVLICVLAYLIEKILEKKLKKVDSNISVREALESLSRIRMIPTKLGNKDFLYTTRLNEKNSKILKAFKIAFPPRLVEVKNH